MPRTLKAGSYTTTDTPVALDAAGTGLQLGELEEVILYVSGATVATGDARVQPVPIAASSTLTYERADLGQLYVRSNAAGVPGTIGFTGWKVE